MHDVAHSQMSTESIGRPLASTDAVGRVWVLVLAAAVLLYALLAGLRTVTDYDLFWQMASGRWTAEHHQIFSTDVFSYTAQGQPWIYPVLSGVIFYTVFLVGGYALLSWLGAITCAATVAVLLRRASFASIVFTAVALPRIAARTGPRAEMFTVLLFAVYVSVLWKYFTDGKARLWLLPALMILWVNLHLGFVAGFALIAGYLCCEALELLFSGERRELAMVRLRRAWPYLLLTVPASLLNPWGWNIYRALVRQNQAMSQHAQWINEWAAVPLGWKSWTTFASLRETKGIFYVLLALAIICVGTAIVRRQLGAALLIGGSAYAAATHVRLQALFACVLVVVGGWVLSNAWQDLAERIGDLRTRRILIGGASALLVLLMLLRSTDLVTNRHYFGGTETATFGAGLSWWFPERAFSYVEQHQIPGQLFNNYNLGGFLLWRLGARYQDYVDGRAIPFGPAIFEKQDRLMSVNPDSPEWQREIERYGINMVVLSLARYDGAPGSLPAFCHSENWIPVYLDEISAVFVRRTPENAAFTQSALNCETVQILPVDDGKSGYGFNHYANAALVLHVLGRQQEALTASTRASEIFPESANLHFIRAKIFTALRMPTQAEQEYRATLVLEPNDVTWASLGQLYASENQTAQAFNAMRNAVEISPRPHLMLVNLAFLYLDQQQPQSALSSLDEAVRRSPAEASSNLPFQLDLARGRAAAWSALGKNDLAIAEEESATRIAPERGDIWMELATLYEIEGRAQQAADARSRANALKANNR
jgi:Tfp pilus assembly protein PilF